MNVFKCSKEEEHLAPSISQILPPVIVKFNILCNLVLQTVQNFSDVSDEDETSIFEEEQNIDLSFFFEATARRHIIEGTDLHDTD